MGEDDENEITGNPKGFSLSVILDYSTIWLCLAAAKSNFTPKPTKINYCFWYRADIVQTKSD